MKKSVLLVDDDVHWLSSLRLLLEDIGYEISEASTARDAIDVLQTNQVKVALIDLALPEKEGDTPDASAGMHLLEFVRSTMPNLPIIVISAYLETHAGELQSAGVMALVNKGSNTAIEDILFQLSKATGAGASGGDKEISKSTLLDSLRVVFREEMARYAPVRERTVYIPDEGQYELIKPLIGFKKEIETRLSRFPFSQNVFLMMKFREQNRDLSEFIVETLGSHGLRGVRADHPDWNITKNVYNPIAVLYCCKYGIALFDEPEQYQAYSPNVAYELGMMHYQEKDCLILRHSSLPIVPFDLIKDLYETYERELRVRQIISNWIRQVAVKQRD